MLSIALRALRWKATRLGLGGWIVEDRSLAERIATEERLLREVLDRDGWSFRSFGTHYSWVVTSCDDRGIERARAVASRPLEAFAMARELAERKLGG